ncbi:MAG TPA: aspartate carbamoyltransferase [Ruminococcus sp.]|nr:aspartate carbamoyltransferase [Ruminococcus sp.]HCR73390.1 aspartate carbamoyltransferase [Ruminococcus sp.]
MNSRYQHLIDLNDYPVSWWNQVIALGQDICRNPQRYNGACNGKIMATLFYEPSTRTQMSFQTAMIRLGGSIIGFDNPATSSVAKGENLKDTTKIVSNYADILIMRNPLAGSAKAAALTADCPVINAGDGGHLHPTQTLTDLLTLKEEKGRLDNLKIGLCGDLINGRTVHSLCKALSCYPNNEFILISTDELRLPSYIKDVLNANNCKFREVFSLDEAIGELDVLYMTRIQRERFASEEEYQNQKDTYILDRKKMKKASPDLIVLHPLPRVDEISVDIDDDPRAIYFKQAKYGMYVRMALIITMLENQSPSKLLYGSVRKDVCCKNPKCITQSESYLPKSFRGKGDILECEYCDERILI